MINGIPRILIVRLSAIGDVVRVLPALHTLRCAYPNAQIDWAVEAKSAAIVEDHPALDRVFVFERPRESPAATRSFWSFCNQIRANRYDVVVDFHGILKSGLLTAASRAPDRYGFARPRGKEGNFLFTNHRVKLPGQHLNRVEENLLLCDALCKRRESLDTTIYVPPEIQDEIDTFYEGAFVGGKKVAIMHAPVDREEKRWPAERYAQLADLLLADGRFEVLLTWGPGQFSTIEAVMASARRHPIIAPETPSLKQFAWLAHRADLYVGGDTGPMHIAAAMGAPVVAIFGGTDPAKHAPYRKPCEVLYAQDPGLSARERLERITPDMAYEACVRLISRP